MVFSHPVCARENQERILDALLALPGKTFFFQIDRERAELLHSRNLKACQLGVETHLDIADFELSGKERAKLHQWKNKSLRQGSGSRRPTVEPGPREIHSLCNAWLADKGYKELDFLTRPFFFNHERHMRFF